MRWDYQEREKNTIGKKKNTKTFEFMKFLEQNWQLKKIVNLEKNKKQKKWRRKKEKRKEKKKEEKQREKENNKKNNKIKKQFKEIILAETSTKIMLIYSIELSN